MSYEPPKNVRARLVWTQAETNDDKLDHQILLDLLIDPQSHLPVGKHPVFGLYGSPVRQEAYPFILLTDGTVDYGDLADPGDRFEKLNVRERKIVVGELVTYSSTDEEWCCRIVTVTDLGAS